MKLSLEKIVPIVFSISMLMLVIIVIFTFRSMDALSKSVDWQTHTRQVLLQLDEVLIKTVDAETHGRGFLITADENFYHDFENSLSGINDSLNNLRELSADNPAQLERIQKLEKALHLRIDLLKEGVELRRTLSLDEVKKRIATGRGREMMNGVRQLIGDLKAEEGRLLTNREADLNNALRSTYQILLTFTVAGLILFGLANLVIYREIAKRRIAEDEMRQSNLELEKRVNKRTHELSESENRYRLALEAGNLGTWSINPHTNESKIDERGLSLFGYSKDDFEGDVFGRVFDKDYAQVQRLFQKSIDENVNFNAEFRVLTADGRLSWNNCVGQPVLDENGKVARLVGNCRDITDIKENEKVIRQSEIFRRAVLDSLSAHIAVLDVEGEIVAVNAAWEQFAEINCVAEKFSLTGVGQNYLKVCENTETFDKNTEAVIKDLRKVLNGELEGFNLEYPCHSPSEERWFLLQATALKSTRGGAVISHINITDRKKAEAELKNSEEFNRSIFENSPDCVNVLELDGTLHSMNTNGLCIMEIDDFRDYIGKQWLDFWQGDENELAYQAIKTANEGKSAHFEGFCRTIKGTPRWWDVSVAPIFDSHGKPLRLIATSRDVTDRRDVERERENLLKNEKIARKEAEIANRLRDEFLANVSHELRAPLNSILGWSRMLEKGNLDEKTSEKAVQTIVRNAEAQNRLIEDLLDVSRIISGKLRLEVLTINPITFVESALETVRPAAEAKNISLEIRQDKVVSHVSGDPNRLQQVIWNLLSNAIKFTPNGGRVTVEIERMGGYAEIRVRDTGIGISEEFLPHVFDRFRQADASSIRKFGGLGLGLAIVRHLVEMHGGTVSVFSEGENKGTIFTIQLPIVNISEDELDGERSSGQFLFSDSPAVSLDGLLILIVDDEEDSRQLLVQSLTFYGATVIAAKSAKAGLRQLKDKNPDVLVSDIGMPDEDGYSLIRKVRALADDHQKNIVAVALTAFTRPQDRMRALSFGFNNHVGKPVELDELATVIASLTGKLRI
jgi:PAS domain S-box-containing protein